MWSQTQQPNNLATYPWHSVDVLRLGFFHFSWSRILSGTVPGPTYSPVASNAIFVRQLMRYGGDRKMASNSAHGALTQHFNDRTNNRVAATRGETEGEFQSKT
jgi:hypothetical protein